MTATNNSNSQSLAGVISSDGTSVTFDFTDIGGPYRADYSFSFTSDNGTIFSEDHNVVIISDSAIVDASTVSNDIDVESALGDGNDMSSIILMKSSAGYVYTGTALQDWQNVADYANQKSDKIFMGASDQTVAPTLGSSIESIGEGTVDLSPYLADAYIQLDLEDSLSESVANVYTVENRGPKDFIGAITLRGIDNLSGIGGGYITGNSNDNFFEASGVNDIVLFGNAGDDDLIGADGEDTLNGGEGADSLQGNDGDDTLLGSRGEDELYGGEGNDILRGGHDNDKLYGGPGNDILYSGRALPYSDDMTATDGSNELYGGPGNDTLVGGMEADVMEGGTGRDEFVFTDISHAHTLNKIKDFTNGDDVIHFKEWDYHVSENAADFAQQSSGALTAKMTFIDHYFTKSLSKSSLISYFADPNDNGDVSDSITFQNKESTSLILVTIDPSVGVGSLIFEAKNADDDLGIGLSELQLVVQLIGVDAYDLTDTVFIL